VAPGIPELREAICARYKLDYGVDITPAEVLMTAGGKQALINTALALFDAGDEVITHAPYWPTIPEQVKLMDAVPVIVRTRPEDGFAVHADAIIAAITPKTKAIILNSPCNPTGGLIDEQAMAAIADAAAARGIWIVVDLCYERLIYDPVPHNLPKVLFDRHRDRTVLCGSASKAYAMTGWRCGWTIAPQALSAAFNVIQGQSTSNITSITQKAALAALTGPQDAVTAMLDEYRRRRDAIHGWLTAHPGITCVKPKGAFYLFPNISGLLSPDGIKTSNDFAQALIEKEYVVVTQGEAFDAPGYLRISYATSMENLREGANRILRFAESLAPAKASAR
jgi:aspartate aminotransferase